MFDDWLAVFCKYVYLNPALGNTCQDLTIGDRAAEHRVRRKAGLNGNDAHAFPAMRFHSGLGLERRAVRSNVE